MATYVIAGVTGRVGSIAAEELLRAGGRPVVIVRDEARGVEWRRRGAVVAHGSLEDRQFLCRTLSGADGFFTLLPENVVPDDFHGARRRLSDAMAQAVLEAGVPHVVMLSAIAAALPEGSGPAEDLHYCESQLRRTVPKLTTLRSCYFQDNVAGMLPAARHAGIYPNFFASADVPIPMIATADVGRLAALALMNPPGQSEIVDLFGPAYSVRDIAGLLGRALHEDLCVVDVPPARHSDALVEAGVPRGLADAVAEMFAAVNAGLIEARGDRRLQGATPIDEVIANLVRLDASAETGDLTSRVR